MCPLFRILETAGRIAWKFGLLLESDPLAWRFTKAPMAGGGAYMPPLASFLNNLKTRADVDAKLTVPYSVSILHPEATFLRNP